MEQRQRKQALRRSLSFLIKLICILGIGVLCWQYVLCLHVVRGVDMYPSLRDGDLVLVYRPNTRYQTDNVVVAAGPEGQFTGRIVAVGSDQVRIPEAGGLYVNGSLQSETIFDETMPVEKQEQDLLVPEDAYFILGDYRTQAADSRIYGCIRREDIQGKIILILRRRDI